MNRLSGALDYSGAPRPREDSGPAAGTLKVLAYVSPILLHSPRKGRQ